MKIKENIFDSINGMNANEMAFLYEYIRLLKKRKPFAPDKRQRFSIDQILEMTASSKGEWSEAIMEEREDRI